MMRPTYFFLLLFTAELFSAATPATSSKKPNAVPSSVPFVAPELWLPSLEVTDYRETTDRPWKPVLGCCVSKQQQQQDDDDDSAEEEEEEKSCDATQQLQPAVIGKMPQFSTQDALAVLHHSVAAWKGGMGIWPQMSLQERIQAIQRFFQELSARKQEMVDILMWEIGKNEADATGEIDRTVQFVEELIETLQSSDEYKGVWKSIGSSTTAFVRRAGMGVIMALAPYNYPINESYATIIPALLMGNVVLVKIPAVGGLAHLLTMEAFAKTLPPGTINFIAGSGRATMPPIMETGLVDGLAFIGSSKAADNLIHSHPHPHRLKVFLQLEANNMGILLSDIFEQENNSVLENAVDEAVLGSLSYNGQRCTALKIFFVHTKHAKTFAQKLAEKIEALPMGLPWQTHGDKAIPSKITPLPNQHRVEYMKSLLDDALSKGAKIINKDGGSIIGGKESTLMVPAVLYPVTPDMNVYHEEQFGPLVPVAVYDDLETVLEFGRTGPYAQQVSIFTVDPKQSAHLLDKFSSVFAKVNLNSQCGRSPDVLPFAGRRSSAMGVMSVGDALREFSVPTVVAYKDKKQVNNAGLVEKLQQESVFLKPVALTETIAEK